MIGYLGLGAWYHPDKTRFTVWAPLRRQVTLLLKDQDRALDMEYYAEDGCWRVEVDGLGPGSRYTYLLDRVLERPDPASFSQPDGVQAPSAVVDHTLKRQQTAWAGLDWDEAVLYEIHVGTFTTAGDLEAIIPRLPELRDLGVTCLNLMPVAQFSGRRNWGYDGVFPFAVQANYGGVYGLKRLVNACHGLGLGIVLDVVYNHLGPEGNPLPDFGPYLSSRYKTPWGWAINLDGAYSDGVRRFFVANALYWLEVCDLDGLRLDAVHALHDRRGRQFLSQLSTAVAALSRASGRQRRLIAESRRNDPALLRPKGLGGQGLDGQWNDDFHHALHALLTGERHSYYQDFGRVADLGTAWQGNYIYTCRYSKYYKRERGQSGADRPPWQFVVYAQNHDQVGNRKCGRRLAALIEFESLKLAAAVVCLSPFTPLLFMGEEYGESRPFWYFTDHTNPSLAEAVRRGRGQETQGPDRLAPPDPQGLESFEASILDWRGREQGRGQVLLSWYRRLLDLRRKRQELGSSGSIARQVKSSEFPGVLFVHARRARSQLVLYLAFSGAKRFAAPWPLPSGNWRLIEDSQALDWDGPGRQGPDRACGPLVPELSPGQVQIWAGEG